MAKLMLVEDDNNLREIYEARLQAEGYEIVTARDGEEALVVAKAEKPDLIISDVMMPKISGFEMLDILRNTDGMKDVKVIMLTALGQNDDQQRAYNLGADFYLVKSQVTLEDIVKVARGLLEDTQSKKAPAVATTPVPAVVVSPPPPQTSPVPPAPTPVMPVAAAPTESPEATAPTAPVTEGVQSTAQEEASIEARIEDFVAGATQDANPPAAADTASVAAPTSPVPTLPSTPVVIEPPVATPPPSAPEATPPSNTNNEDDSADDKLMADAVQTLAANTSNDESVPDVLAPPVEKDSPATPVETITSEKPEKASSVPIAHKKVISPPNSEPKKDIETLLALEEAKQTAVEPTEQPAAAVIDSDLAATVIAPAASILDTPTAETGDVKIEPSSITL